MIAAAPGATFEASLQNAPTGLVGTIGVRIMDGQGATTTARTTTGIVETPAGSGIYVATLTAPTTAGTYQVVWDTGSVTPSTTAVDDLIVTSTASAVSVPSGADLTTLAAVRSFMLTPAADTGQDDLVQSSITRASLACMRYMDRQVRPLDTVDAVRMFRIGGASRSRTIPVKDLSAAPTTIRVLADDAVTAVTTVQVSDRLLLPLDRQSTDPIEAIRLLPAAGPLAPEWYVEVTGKWGWPVVPADVEEACILTVVARMRSNVQAFATAVNLADSDALGRPEGIPQSARRLLDYYRGAPGVG
jgi:hypothetical protein